MSFEDDGSGARRIIATAKSQLAVTVAKAPEM